MKIVPIKCDNAALGTTPTIVGSSGDESIVSVGTWKKQITSFEIFKVENGYYFLDDLKNSDRILVGSHADSESCLIRFENSPRKIIEALSAGWATWTPKARRRLLTSTVSKFYVPCLVGLLLVLWIANLNIVKIALAPTIEVEDRKREFVYLALDDFMKTRPLPVAIRIVAAVPTQIANKNSASKRDQCLKESAKTSPQKSLDTDVMKFISPRFLKSSVVARKRCL